MYPFVGLVKRTMKPTQAILGVGLCLLVGRVSVCCGDWNESWFVLMQV